MKIEFLKTLWLLRFDKIKKTEDEAAWNYQELYDRCLQEFGPENEVVKMLAQLVHDERIHAKLGEELIDILHHNHPECGLL